MADSSTSPLVGVDLGDIGSAFEATSGAENSDSSRGSQGQGGAGPSAGGNRGNAPPVQSLDFILDIPLKVTAELGRSKMAVRDILQLSQGSVIELSKFAGEPLEILVNDKLIARGEVVVVNEKFGIRLTDIISPIERIEQLK